jgi:hypothetical protein
MPTNDQYDDLFDGWGQALNVDPQLAKTVFHQESAGDPNVKDNAGAVGPMQMKPATAKAMAVKLGLDPNAIDLHDMRWAVPLSMQYLADGVNATKSAEGALGYYSTGSADPKRWSRAYLDKAAKTYDGMTLKPAATQGAPAAPADGQDTTRPPAAQPAPAPSQATQDAPPADGSAVASTASSLVGNNATSIKPFLAANGQSLDPTRANWCAAFVNATLEANGVEGTSGPTKNVATGFLKWGAPVADDPQPGDVLVQPRGHPAGGLGGHVGIATGHVAEGPSGTFYLMQSGNLNGKVSYSWEPAQSIVVRRAAPRSTPTLQASR